MSTTLDWISEVQWNEQGWGPVGDMHVFDGLPFQPFSKSDRLGHVCITPVRADLPSHSFCVVLAQAADFSANPYHKQSKNSNAFCSFFHSHPDAIHADRYQAQFTVGDTFVFDAEDTEDFQIVTNDLPSRPTQLGFARPRKFQVCIECERV